MLITHVVGVMLRLMLNFIAYEIKRKGMHWERLCIDQHPEAPETRNLIRLQTESGISLLYNSCPDCVKYKPGYTPSNTENEFTLTKLGGLCYYVNKSEDAPKKDEHVLQVEIKKKAMDYNKRFGHLFPIWAQAVLGANVISRSDKIRKGIDGRRCWSSSKRRQGKLRSTMVVI